jgi:two-component system OmpR family response regulator
VPQGSAGRGKGRSVRVFIVEDSPVIRERLTESLSSPGRIDVVGYAESEANAVAALQAGDWDAVILDLQLKEGNGLRVLKALRAAREGKLIIVLTNYAFPQYRARSEQLGADYFFDKSREYHRVREVLEQRAATQH